MTDTYPHHILAEKLKKKKYQDVKEYLISKTIPFQEYSKLLDYNGLKITFGTKFILPGNLLILSSKREAIQATDKFITILEKLDQLLKLLPPNIKVIFYYYNLNKPRRIFKKNLVITLV